MLQITHVKIDFVDALDKVREGRKLDGTERVVETVSMTATEFFGSAHQLEDVKMANDLRKRIKTNYLDTGRVANVYFTYQEV